MKKSLLINIVLTTLLLVVLLYEKYPLRIYKKIDSYLNKDLTIGSYTYLDNSTFQEQIDLYQTYRGQKNIVMLGTSLTYGVNWNELLNRADIANRGIGSDITEGYVHRLHFVLNLNPKICFIEGGINDILYQINPDSSIKNLNLVIDTLVANDITPVLTTVFYVTKKFNQAENFNSKVDSFNKKIIILAKQRNIKVMDVNTHFKVGGFMHLENVRTDGLHLSGKGYLIWKEQIVKILQQKKI